jgi:hypothetical protein
VRTGEPGDECGLIPWLAPEAEGAFDAVDMRVHAEGVLNCSM